MIAVIHLTIPADGLNSFLAYEDRVLPILEHYGCRLLERFVAENRSEEFHIIQYPSEEALQAYRNDAARIAAQGLWEESGAESRFLPLLEFL